MKTWFWSKTSASTISTKLVLTNLLLALSDVEICQLAGNGGRLAFTLTLVGICLLLVSFWWNFLLVFFGGPLKKNNLTFFGGHACPRWCPPLVHPATTPLQRRPRCQRPPCSQQTTEVMLGVDSVGPHKCPNILVPLLLLLHPELPVAIFKSEWELQYCNLMLNIEWYIL